MGRRRAEKNARRQRRRQRERTDRAAPPARPTRVRSNGLAFEEHLVELRQLIDALGRGDAVSWERPLELDWDAEGRVPDVEAVLALGADPLPAEARSLPQLDPSGRRLVEEVLDLAEPVAVAIGRAELRTSLRRFAAMAATHDPGLLLDLPPRRAAAAAVWAVGEINGCFTPFSRHPATLLGALGQDSCYVEDGRRMLRALGWEDEFEAGYTVLHPRLTTSTTRAELFRHETEEDWCGEDWYDEEWNGEDWCGEDWYVDGWDDEPGLARDDDEHQGDDAENDAPHGPACICSHRD